MFTSTSHRPTRGQSRGRGRRGSYVPAQVHHNVSWVRGVSAPVAAATTTTTTTLTTKASSSSSSSTPSSTSSSNAFVQKPGTFRNRSLVLNSNNKTAVTSSSSLASEPEASASKTTDQATNNDSQELEEGELKEDVQPKPKPTPESLDKNRNREVVIGGVVFVADARGRKLVRKPGQPVTSSTGPPTTTMTPTPSHNSTGPSPSPNATPKRASVQGTVYIRTKAGNLVSLDFARKKKEAAEKLKAVAGLPTTAPRGRSSRRGAPGRQGTSRLSRTAQRVDPRSLQLCRYFQRTGQCTHALTCPYKHDSSRVSLCLPSLRTPSQCPHTASTCVLSHVRKPENTPHCLHFPNCRHADSCAYEHVQVSESAPLCEDFARLGWCDAGRKCGKKHSRECWDFSQTGKCTRKGCKERHVLRRHGFDGEGEGQGGGETEGEEGSKKKRLRDDDDDDDVDRGRVGELVRRRVGQDHDGSNYAHEGGAAFSEGDSFVALGEDEEETESSVDADGDSDEEIRESEGGERDDDEEDGPSCSSSSSGSNSSFDDTSLRIFD